MKIIKNKNKNSNKQIAVPTIINTNILKEA